MERRAYPAPVESPIGQKGQVVAWVVRKVSVAKAAFVLGLKMEKRPYGTKKRLLKLERQKFFCGLSLAHGKNYVCRQASQGLKIPWLCYVDVKILFETFIKGLKFFDSRIVVPFSLRVKGTTIREPPSQSTETKAWCYIYWRSKTYCRQKLLGEGGSGGQVAAWVVGHGRMKPEHQHRRNRQHHHVNKRTIHTYIYTYIPAPHLTPSPSILKEKEWINLSLVNSATFTREGREHLNGLTIPFSLDLHPTKKDFMTSLLFVAIPIWKQQRRDTQSVEISYIILLFPSDLWYSGLYKV